MCIVYPASRHLEVPLTFRRCVGSVCKPKARLQFVGFYFDTYVSYVLVRECLGTLPAALKLIGWPHSPFASNGLTQSTASSGVESEHWWCLLKRQVPFVALAATIAECKKKEGSTT